MEFPQVASVAGGTAAWAEAGKPLDRGEVDDQATRVIETEWAHAGGTSAAWALFNCWSAFAVGRAQDMAVDRLHHVVEDLREHRGGKEADRP